MRRVDFRLVELGVREHNHTHIDANLKHSSNCVRSRYIHMLRVLTLVLTDLKLILLVEAV